MKKVLGGVAVLAGALLVAVVAYAAYVLASSYRLDDMLTLAVEEPADGAALEATVQPGEELVAVTANLDFAYSDHDPVMLRFMVGESAQG